MKKFAIALALAGCTSSSSTGADQLPSATVTPHLDSQTVATPCGSDIAYYGATTPDVSYRYTFDVDGRITSTSGVWAYDGSTESYAYAWNGDLLASMQWDSDWDASAALFANYDASNNLVDYTYTFSDGTNTEAWTYGFADFIAPNQPTRQTISTDGQVVASYDLVYDAANRLIEAVPDSGPSTTWAYDDAALTVTSDTGNGAFVGVVSYDADYRLLSEVWTGNDPDMIDSEEVYAWTGNQLDAITWSSGSEGAPHQLELVAVDTLLYNCPTARTGGSRSTTKLVKPRLAH